ncbi:MAG TPA: TetR/AcrR family transcriptional regulator [Azospira sp.]|nr:TetR/AcrR family transcriptional regulator [Azospira sp.]
MVQATPILRATPSAADTRERILDAAEHLFMENGFEATSMRMITGAAEVNLAAVNYHFGSKDQLIQEVFRRRLTWLNQERLRILDELEAQAGEKPIKPSLIVDAFFGTLIRMAEDEALGGKTFMRLIGRTMTDPSGFIRAFFAEEYAGVVDRYKQALFKSLPDVPKAEIVWRFHFMLGATSYAIAGTDALRIVTDWGIEPSEAEDRLDKLLPRLMSFLIGGLRAPLPQFDPSIDSSSEP